jgi:hypothetical protein
VGGNAPDFRKFYIRRKKGAKMCLLEPIHSDVFLFSLEGT